MNNNESIRRSTEISAGKHIAVLKIIFFWAAPDVKWRIRNLTWVIRVGVSVCFAKLIFCENFRHLIVLLFICVLCGAKEDQAPILTAKFAVQSAFRRIKIRQHNTVLYCCALKSTRVVLCVLKSKPRCNCRTDAKRKAMAFHNLKSK